MSLQYQTYTNYQWIVYIDDELSTYEDVIPKIKKLVPNTVFLGGKHIGRVRALNEAHKVATGEYIALLDDDDWLAISCLEECHIQKGHDIIYTDFYYIRNNIVTVGLTNKQRYSLNTMLCNNIMFHFRVYKAELYKAVGGFDISFDTTMDYEITLRMLILNPTIKKINLPLYYYWSHPDSISGKFNSSQQVNKVRAVDKILKLINKFQPADRVKLGINMTS